MDVHTELDSVPPLDDDLEEHMEALRGIDEGLDLALDGLRHVLLARHDQDRTQTLVAALGGWEKRNLVALTGRIIARLADPDTNPALRTLPLEQQKLARQAGADTAHWLGHPSLTTTASDTSAAITGT
jgi:hypothetical protein